MNRSLSAHFVRSLRARRQPAATRGFTLVELLVVITILAMLVALLIPAVQMAREAARKSQCMNNEKQLFTGVFNYVTAKQKFPPLFTAQPQWIGPPATAPAVGWVPNILPYIEQNEKYRLYQSNQLVNQPDWVVEVLNCPTRAPQPGARAPLSYVPNAGVSDGTVFDQPMEFVENGLFLDEYTPRLKSTDPGYRGVKATAPIDLSYLASHDGAGKTILLAENHDALDWYSPLNPVATSPKQPKDFPGQSWWNAITWMQPENAPDAWGTDQDSAFPSGTKNLLGKPAALGSTPADRSHGRPYSEHSDGFHVVYAGGAIEFMSSDIEYRIYCLLMSPDSANTKYSGGLKQDGVSPTQSNPGTKMIYPKNWHQGYDYTKPLRPATTGTNDN